MSTCSILQPHHDFVMSKIKSVIIPPAPDTIFTLLNCSRDSSVLNHYRSLCFNFSGHSCDELYGSCTSFRLFHLLSNNTPPCCFTGYDTVKYMSMNTLDCTHYTTVYNTDGLHGVAPLDWIYGIKLSYSVPNTGCDRCGRSGGTCGFDVETEGMDIFIFFRSLLATSACYYETGLVPINPFLLRRLDTYKMKRTEEAGQVNEPRYCKYHRLISHPTEKCFTLKEVIMDLSKKGKIHLDDEQVEESNNTSVIFGAVVSSASCQQQENKSHKASMLRASKA
ncbi:hypothetical protein RJ639_027784 [Escallonia herrerae]|uniref:Uncharacterized protein n=1 Tax=Escallonia herrerae TaxID=1293975 RepID=A0AA88X7F3_9ASTE|nr:hypothetical protein RJ639_027784 [Escallonia herrerae]